LLSNFEYRNNNKECHTINVIVLIIVINTTTTSIDQYQH